jgi:hypothetical protein
MRGSVRDPLNFVCGTERARGHLFGSRTRGGGCGSGAGGVSQCLPLGSEPTSCWYCTGERFLAPARSHLALLFLECAGSANMRCSGITSEAWPSAARSVQVARSACSVSSAPHSTPHTSFCSPVLLLRPPARQLTAVFGIDLVRRALAERLPTSACSPHRLDTPRRPSPERRLPTIAGSRPAGSGSANPLAQSGSVGLSVRRSRFTVRNRRVFGRRRSGFDLRTRLRTNVAAAAAAADASL